MGDAELLHAGWKERRRRMPDRRKSERYEPSETILGKVKATVPARVVDISEHGLQVEVPAALRPSVECDLTLSTEDGKIRVRARVQRCRAAELAATDGSDRRMMYRAGLEFVEICTDAGRILSTMIEGLRATSGMVAAAAAGAKAGRAARRPKGPIRIRIDAEAIRKRLQDEN